jgi:hypothetical protein
MTTEEEINNNDGKTSQIILSSGKKEKHRYKIYP